MIAGAVKKTLIGNRIKLTMNETTKSSRSAVCGTGRGAKLGRLMLCKSLFRPNAQRSLTKKGRLKPP